MSNVMVEEFLPEFPMETAEVNCEIIYAGHQGTVEACDWMKEGDKLYSKEQMIAFAREYFKLNQK